MCGGGAGVDADVALVLPAGPQQPRHLPQVGPPEAGEGLEARRPALEAHGQARRQQAAGGHQVRRRLGGGGVRGGGTWRSCSSCRAVSRAHRAATTTSSRAARQAGREGEQVGVHVVEEEGEVEVL